MTEGFLEDLDSYCIKNMNMNIFELIGIATVLAFLITTLRKLPVYLYLLCVKKTCFRDVLTKQKGRWAVVTGATDGIGKAYANALAAKGLNIMLISRDIKKLNTCADEISARHNVETRILVIDFTKSEEIYDEISRALADLQIGILVNNVGISYSYPEYFLDLPDRTDLIMSLIRANVVSVTKMCEIVMPEMVARKSGIIINISSATALFPSPMLSVYAATKAYVERFSDNLRYEYKGTGLVIQTVLPGFVATKMTKIRRSTIMAPSPKTFVEGALLRVGVYNYTCGYLPHSIFVNCVRVLYDLWESLCMYLILRSMKGTRERSLAAMKRRAEEDARE